MKNKARLISKIKDLKFPLWGWFYVFFGIIFVSNGFMVYWASNSFTGLVVKEPYEEGLAYNGTLAEKEAQLNLGWGSTFKLSPITKDGVKQKLVFILRKRDTSAVTGADVSLTLFRPTMDGMDVTFPLTEMPNTGVYEGVITLPAKGQWDFRFTAKRGKAIYKVNEVKVIY